LQPGHPWPPRPSASRHGAVFSANFTRKRAAGNTDSAVIHFRELALPMTVSGRAQWGAGATMQVMYALIAGTTERLELPSPDEYVLPGIRWGAFDELLTPAYWRGQAWQHERLGTYRHLRLGHTLAEELAACLLGGFGMKAELGLAAYARLRDRGLLEGTPTDSLLERSLAEPFVIRGYARRYRFPRQKARYLAGCLRLLSDFAEPSDDVVLRDQLAEFPGIGLKTASWIVRNYCGSNRVAVLDVHILRAGRHIGLFPPEISPQRHYCNLEDAFIRFAAALDTGAGMLDGMIWDYMRRFVLITVTSRNVLGRRAVAMNRST
jgi:thermostable 8-oxoguanine DNA glycosylase